MNENVGRHTHLFQDGQFKSHSGLDLFWKIECDALADEEWKCIAKMIMEYQVVPFSRAEGIPRGGKKLASYLDEYSTQNSDMHPVMIVDDVLTTGGSMIEYSKQFTDPIGWVVFARNIPPKWVTTLFQMPEYVR